MNMHRTLAECTFFGEREKAKQPDNDEDFSWNRSYADKGKIMANGSSRGSQSQK
jgi:hypothetical protein